MFRYSSYFFKKDKAFIEQLHRDIMIHTSLGRQGIYDAKDNGFYKPEEQIEFTLTRLIRNVGVKTIFNMMEQPEYEYKYLLYDMCPTWAQEHIQDSACMSIVSTDGELEITDYSGFYNIKKATGIFESKLLPTDEERGRLVRIKDISGDKIDLFDIKNIPPIMKRGQLTDELMKDKNFTEEDRVALFKYFAYMDENKWLFTGPIAESPHAREKFRTHFDFMAGVDWQEPPKRKI